MWKKCEKMQAKQNKQYQRDKQKPKGLPRRISR